MLDFRTFEILTFDRVKRANMCHRTKSCRNRTNRCQDMAICFQNGGRPPSSICYVRSWTTDRQHVVVFIIVQNMVGTIAVFSTI